MKVAPAPRENHLTSPHRRLFAVSSTNPFTAVLNFDNWTFVVFLQLRECSACATLPPALITLVGGTLRLSLSCSCCFVLLFWFEGNSLLYTLWNEDLVGTDRWPCGDIGDLMGIYWWPYGGSSMILWGHQISTTDSLRQFVVCFLFAVFIFIRQTFNWFLIFFD